MRNIPALRGCINDYRIHSNFRKVKSVFNYFERILKTLEINVEDLKEGSVNDMIRKQVFALCAKKISKSFDDFKRLKPSTLLNYLLKAGVKLEYDTVELELK